MIGVFLLPDESPPLTVVMGKEIVEGRERNVQDLDHARHHGFEGDLVDVVDILTI